MDSGSGLLIAVGVLAIIALVLVASAKPDGQRAPGRGTRTSSLRQGPIVSDGAMVPLRQPRVEDAESLRLPESPLMIPPPDEVRIQAVAPNNDLRSGR
ncbi:MULTISPECIES: hypothetical protein [Pseudomonadati]|uniref:hypothetical protein n=1 Tax=Pseudomonadati TaxID=3379134 RepID=UPI001124B027|nr:hypothetical protein [Corallococcus exiguus]TNV43239.1 hypothetical protein FH620_43930 [Corallococcus exiguus]